MNNLFENILRTQAVDLFGGNEEPVTGHRERFAGKLDAWKKKKRLRRLYRNAGYAAAAVVLALTLLLFRWNSQPPAQEDSISEVRNYYSMQLESEMKAIEQLLVRMDENERANLLNDIQSVREGALPEVETQEVMIRIYQSRIEALRHIQNILINYI
jgi:hypothetical protein